MEIPNDWFANERGNTWLMDDDGNHVMWVDVVYENIFDGLTLKGVKPKIRMEISICPNDYPGLNICMLTEQESTDEHLAKHIHEKCIGWYARKCNIEGVKIQDETIADISELADTN